MMVPSYILFLFWVPSPLIKFFSNTTNHNDRWRVWPLRAKGRIWLDWRSVCRYIVGRESHKARSVSVSSEDVAWRVKWRQIAEKYGLDRIRSQLVKVVETIHYQTRHQPWQLGVTTNCLVWRSCRNIFIKLIQVFWLVWLQGRRRENQRPNGSLPQQTYRPPAPELEEDAFIRLRSETTSSKLDEGQEDIVRVVRGVLDRGNGVPSSSHCPKLDIISMDCPRPAGGREDEQDQDLIRVVKGLLDKENQQNRDDQIRREWRLLAETVDRWLFWSFFLITTVSTLLFLVILPYNHRGKFFWVPARRKTSGSGGPVGTAWCNCWWMMQEMKSLD